MNTPTELRLTEFAGPAREVNALPEARSEPEAADAATVEPAAFDDDVRLWALASSTCGGIDACLGSDAERRS
ncbi:MAG: hypothetical protein ABIQ99_17095 [Thermoflexales bacterium]